MRLIDVDALIKRFEGLRDEHETLYISYVALYEVLVATPTAYDVDAVVAELEANSNRKLGYVGYTYSIGLGTAKEIVKKGGVQ